MKKIPGIICIEGPDGVGKTTLAEHFVKEYGAVNLHATYRFKKMIPAYHEALRRKAESVSKAGRLAILDRHWITEAIYARIFRGGTQWPDYTHSMDETFQNMGVLTVLCVPNSIQESLDRRKKRDEVDPENLEREKPVNAGKAYDQRQMVELFSRYLDLWRGTMFCEGDDRVADLTRTGGVCDRDDFLRYRIEVEGLDVDSFAKYAIRRMKRLQSRIDDVSTFMRR